MTVEGGGAGGANGRNDRSRGSNAVMITKIGYATSHKAGKKEKIGHVSASIQSCCNLLATLHPILDTLRSAVYLGTNYSLESLTSLNI